MSDIRLVTYLKFGVSYETVKATLALISDAFNFLHEALRDYKREPRD